MTRFCPVCKTVLSSHAPEGYCPECAAKKTSGPSNSPLSICQGPIVTPEAERLSAAVFTHSLGIDILLVTYEELAAIAAERPEINAAMQSLSYQITWKGVPVIAVDAGNIESHAQAQVRHGYRVARLQPGLGLKPGDPKWETLAKQEPKKLPEYWGMTKRGVWHLFRDDVQGAPREPAVCGKNPEVYAVEPDHPRQDELCPFCFALTSDRPGCTQISTTEIP